MSIHRSIMESFDLRCPQCHKQCRCEKPKPPKYFLGYDLADNNITRFLIDEATKAFALTPEELGYVNRVTMASIAKPAPHRHPYSVDRNVRDNIAKICGCAECQEYLKSPKENNEMPLNHTVSIDLSSYFNGPSKSSSPTPEQSLLSAINDFAKDDPSLAKRIKETVERVERDRNERIKLALEGCADLELLKEPQGRRFVLALLQNGTVEISHGINYAYGQGFDDDDKYKEKRVFVAGHLVGCGAHYSMEDLEENLDNRGFTYHIEYYPDQD